MASVCHRTHCWECALCHPPAWRGCSHAMHSPEATLGQEAPSDPLWLLPEIPFLEEAGYSSDSFLSKQQIFPPASGCVSRSPAALLGCWNGGLHFVPVEEFGMPPVLCVRDSWWDPGRTILGVP